MTLKVFASCGKHLFRSQVRYLLLDHPIILCCFLTLSDNTSANCNAAKARNNASAGG
jgi:hypothetical protein